MSIRRTRPLPPLFALALAAVAALGVPVPSAAAERPPAYRPGEVVVRYAPGVDRASRAATQRATGTGAPEAFAPRTRTLQIRDGRSVGQAVRALRRRPGVLSADPNFLARISAFVPDDPGPAGAPCGDQLLPGGRGVDPGAGQEVPLQLSPPAGSAGGAGIVGHEGAGAGDVVRVG